MGYLRQSIAAVIALTSIVLLIPFVDAQTGITTATWQAGGATGAIAAGPAAAVLNDGRILVAGYTPTTGNASATVAIYNPATSTWTSAGSMLAPRTGHTATALTNGLVLIAGGKIVSPGTGAFSLTGSLELFNPSTGTSTAVIGAGLAIPRSGHAAMRLQDGRVLFVGGANNLGALDIAEIYNPSTNTMSQATGQMSAKRSNPSATRLPDGRVLVAGGRDDVGVDLATAEIFDPTSQEFSAVSTMAAARSGHAAALLPFNNNVLVFGGSSNGTSLASAELYNPATGTWTTTASMAAPRVSGFAAATPEGGAIAIGGGPTSAEFYRFVSISSETSPTSTITAAGPVEALAVGELATAGDSGLLLDFPSTGQPLLPGGGTFQFPFFELTNSILDRVHQNELVGETSYDGSTQTLTMKMYPQWMTFASQPAWFQATSFSQSTDENLAISPCNQPGAFTDNNPHNGIYDTEDLNGNHVLDTGEDANGNGILDAEPPIECGRSEIRAHVDNHGHLVGAGTDTDVLMKGHVIKEHFDAALGHFVTDVDVNGTLLTGRIVEFGFENPSGDMTLPQCPGRYDLGADGLCHSEEGFSVNPPRCPANFTVNATDGTCHSPAARFQFRVVVTGGLLVDPTRSEWCVAIAPQTCHIDASLDRFDRNSDLGIDIRSANITGTLASGVLSGYASGTAGAIPRVSGLSPTTTTLAFDQTAPYTYNGSPFTATAVATATDGLHVDVPVVYTGDCTHVTAAGCTATAIYHGDSTHADSSATQTITIAPRPITFRADDVTRTYGETTPAFTYSVTAGSIVGTDTFGTPFFAPDGSDRGIHTIVLSGLSNPDYAITFAPGTLTVTPRELTVTALGENKVYDGTTTANVTLGDNRMPTDIFTPTYVSANFADQHVGMDRTIDVTGISIAGPDAANYTFNTTTTTTGDITPRPLTITATGVDKIYDGTTDATVALHDDRVAGDLVTATYIAAFGDRNTGTGKAVSVTGIVISGIDAANYTANATASTTADITKRPLTVTATGINKVYDGNTTATVTLSDNRISGDLVTVTYTAAAFATKSIGLAKAVAVSGIGISGGDAGNYTVNTTASTTANITPRQLTVTATGIDKGYDGNTTATVTLSTNALAGDLVTANYGSATFDSANVGLRNVTVTSITIGGVDGGNYTPNATASTTANITARPLTVTASGVNKVYDGNRTATVTLSDDRVAGDVLTITYGSALFLNRNVGTAKTVDVTGIALAGAAAGNYTANTTASTTANITPRALTVTATGANKIYDGTRAATVTLSDDRLAIDSAFTVSYASALFADKNVGTGKPISVTGITLAGAGRLNYTANTTASTTADITARALTVTAVGLNKVYDGTTNATVSLSDNRVAGDVFTDAYTAAAFATKNVGTGKPVTVSGISIGGTDAGNYTANATASATADITARSLTVTATGVNKIYDSTTAATVTLSDNRVAGDVFTDAYTAAVFANKNVGTGKTVTVSGVSISGTDAANYSANTTTSTTANITAKPLTVTATGVNKVYDGNTTGTVTLSDNRISGDVITATYTTAAFADENVGTAKAVTVSGIGVGGTDAGNYTANTTASTAADITKRALTVTATGVNKVYDGNTTATVTLSDNRINGDLVTLSYTTAAFADENVGTGKAVTVSGIGIGGTDAGNYTANTTASTTADITKRPLTVTATGINKVYDGNTTATVTLSDNRISGDLVTVTYTTAAFADENIGTGKAVTVSGIGISGGDAGNYALSNTTASATANITKRSLTVTATAANKVYDGNTTATVTLSDNRISGDLVTLTYTTAAFADENVGTAKAVTVSGIGIGGTDAGNYTANTTALATADITKRPLTVTATGVNKVYDGTVAATVTLSDNRISGDVLTATYLATFADENVANGKTVTVTGITLAGTAAGNYTANATTSTTANITARPLTVTATGINKVYDGTVAATVTLSDNRISGDAVTDAYTSAVFANKNVGVGKAVTVNGISISGADATNYTMTSTGTATANITTRPLTVTATGVNKVYDGTVAATVTLSDNRINGDAVTDAFTSAVFANKNVGAGKTVTVNGISISGADATNYTLTSTGTATADITTRPLTVTATGVNKVYDGGTTATVTLSDNRISGDVLTATYLATFADKNVGTGKTVTVTGITISGADAANYSANTSASASADITSKAASVTPNPASKTYGAADPPLTGALNGFVPGDAVTASYSRVTGETVAGGPYAISATLTPAAVLGNYTITNNTANFTISKATASVSATGGSFTYDGAAHGGTGSATGGRSESLPVTLSYAGTGTTTYGPAATAPTNAGTYTVVASTTGDGNNIGATSSPAALTINKATATVTLSGLTKTFTGSAQSPTATTTPAGLAIIWTGAPQTNAGSYPVTATVNDANYQGSASGTFVITGTAPTVTATLAVSALTLQYSDQETFTLTVTSSIPGQPAAGVNFFVGSQQVGNPVPVTVPLVAVGDPATATTYKAVWTGQLLEPTPTGQMKPGIHIVSASFVNPNFTMANPANKSVNIAREDARIGGLDRTSYSLGGSATGVVPLTVTVKDISAMVGDAAFDAFAGDIRNAQVQFIDRVTNTVIGTANVSTLLGSGTTTGTATFNWSVNLGTATSKTYTIGFSVLNYYTRTSTADNVVVTVAK